MLVVWLGLNVALLQATASVLERTLTEAMSVAAAAEKVREMSKERCRG